MGNGATYLLLPLPVLSSILLAMGRETKIDSAGALVHAMGRGIGDVQVFPEDDVEVLNEDTAPSGTSGNVPKQCSELGNEAWPLWVQR